MDQKDHSTLEINSPKGGDIAPKMGKTLSKIFKIFQDHKMLSKKVEKNTLRHQKKIRKNL